MLNFVWNVKKSFRKVKRDIEDFKQNANEWIVFLDGRNNKIEKRLDKIEAKLERLEEAMFRVLSLR